MDRSYSISHHAVREKSCVEGCFLGQGAVRKWKCPFNAAEKEVLGIDGLGEGPHDPDSALQAVAEAYGLTVREKTIFILMARGQSTAEISETLFISKGAVRAHQSRVYAKLNIHTQQELLELADHSRE